MSVLPVLRVLVADDEETARKRAIRLLSELGGIEIVAQCTHGLEVLREAAATSPDMLLLDVDMPGLSGLEAGKLLASGPWKVVYCTAHSEHAVAAFEQGAADYLVKPLALERLAKAVERVRAQLGSGAAPAVSVGVSVQYAPIAIPTHEGVRLLGPHDISHAVIEGELVRIHTRTESLLSDMSLQALESKLPQGLVDRVHRKALLNLSEVLRLEPCASGGYDAHTRSGHVVEVSRQAARELRVRLGLR